jgi:hypothetical protein
MIQTHHLTPAWKISIGVEDKVSWAVEQNAHIYVAETSLEKWQSIPKCDAGARTWYDVLSNLRWSKHYPFTYKGHAASVVFFL